MAETKEITINDIFSATETVVLDARITALEELMANHSHDARGSSTISSTMRSANFASGNNGWEIRDNGDVEFNNGTFRGSLEANSISIPNDTTVNSFHSDFSGNSWWGSIAIGDSVAKILNTGVATFSNITITGASSSVITSALNKAVQSFTNSLVFSITDLDTVAWAAGTLKTGDGTSYSIDAGNTGNMAALTYIYLDIAVSTTVLQTTTTYSTAVGDGKILVAAAQNGTVKASVIPYGGPRPIVTGDNISAGSIIAGNIAASTITADKMNVSTLSSITADVGTLTAGVINGLTITGGIVQTGTSGQRIKMSSDILQSFQADGYERFRIRADAIEFLDPSAILRSAIVGVSIASDGVDGMAMLLTPSGYLGVSSITRSGTTATLTTSSAHGASNGWYASVYGANQSEYNGTFVITVTGTTTFTYVMTGDPGASATGTLNTRVYPDYYLFSSAGFLMSGGQFGGDLTIDTGGDSAIYFDNVSEANYVSLIHSTGTNVLYLNEHFDVGRSITTGEDINCGGSVITGGNVSPDTDDSYTLGSVVVSNKRWADIRTVLINGSSFLSEKNVIKDISDYDFIGKMPRLIEFTWKKENNSNKGKTFWGFAADDLPKEIANEEEKAVNVLGAIAYAYGAIKQLKQEVEQLKKLNK